LFQKPLFIHNLFRFWEHVAIMNLKSREYQNIFLFLRRNTSQYMKQRIYWTNPEKKSIGKNLERLFIKSLIKIFSSDHKTSYYPRRLEPHNLELFRIDVTNRLEIFCEAALQCFQFRNWERIFHSRRALFHHPAFFQPPSIGFPCWTVGWSGCRDFGSQSSKTLIVVFF